MFSNRLKELRTSHGYSMDELANIYNQKFNGKLNKSTLSRYENGLQEPMLYVARNFASLFGTTLDDLVNEKSTAEQSDELLNALLAKPTKYKMAQLICQMNDEQLERMKTLLEAALLLPPE